jgi:hypothetical protein
MISRLTITLLAILLCCQCRPASAGDDPELHVDQGSWSGSRWLEASGSSPAEMPGPDSVYWQLRISMYDSEPGSRALSSMPSIAKGQPAVARSMWRSGSEYALDEQGLPMYKYIVWAIPEALTDEFRQFGHLDLPDFLPADVLELPVLQDLAKMPALTEQQQRNMFENILDQSRELTIEGIHLYIYAPGMARAEISLGWRDMQQAVPSLRFYRTEAEKQAELDAGLVYHEQPFPLAKLTVFLDSPLVNE